MSSDTQDRLLEVFTEALGAAGRDIMEQSGRGSDAGNAASAAASTDAVDNRAGTDGTAPGGAEAGAAQWGGAGLPASGVGVGDVLGEAVAGALYAASANYAGSNVYAPRTSGTSGSGGGSTAESVASTFFESGFGMAALVKGLLGLFSGGPAAPPPLEKYEMPAPILFESAETPAGLSASDYDQNGAPRALAGGGGSGPESSSNAPAQITVNVQAMDAQSFLDHSNEIAQAVRGAMLNMSSLNDVVNEL